MAQRVSRFILLLPSYQGRPPWWAESPMLVRKGSKMKINPIPSEAWWYLEHFSTVDPPPPQPNCKSCTYGDGEAKKYVGIWRNITITYWSTEQFRTPKELVHFLTVPAEFLKMLLWCLRCQKSRLLSGAWISTIRARGRDVSDPHPSHLQR